MSPDEDLAPALLEPDLILRMFVGQVVDGERPEPRRHLRRGLGVTSRLV